MRFSVPWKRSKLFLTFYCPDEPELINKDPYNDGWIIKIKVTDPTEIDELLDAGAYKKLIEP